MSHCNFSAREQALLQPCLFLLSLAVNIATRSLLQFLVGFPPPFRETVIGKLPSYFQAGEVTAFCIPLAHGRIMIEGASYTPGEGVDTPSCGCKDASSSSSSQDSLLEICLHI